MPVVIAGMYYHHLKKFMCFETIDLKKTLAVN